MKYEEINTSANQDKLQLSDHTAQIYQDSLYVYGGRKGQEFYRNHPTNELWSFNLGKRRPFETLAWKLWKPLGESPGPRERASSFLFDHHLCIYGGKGAVEGDPKIKDFFMLNLSNLLKILKFFNI